MWSRSPKKELGGHNLSLILVQITWRWQQFLQRKKGQCLRALGRPGVVPPQCMAPISQIPTLDWALRHQVCIAGTSLWRRWGASVHNPLIFIEALLQSDQYKWKLVCWFICEPKYCLCPHCTSSNRWSTWRSENQLPKEGGRQNSRPPIEHRMVQQ